MVFEETLAALDDDELTPRFLKTLIAITVGFLVVVGILTYVVTFVVLGF
jgi:hypothetical protein